MRSSLKSRIFLIGSLLALQHPMARAQPEQDDVIARTREANRQMQINIDRMRMESDRSQQEASRLIDDMVASRRIREQQQRINEALKQVEESEARAKVAAKKAEEDAENRVEEIRRAARHSRNNIYLGVILGACSLGIYTLIKKHGGERQMSSSQKDGIVVMLVSLLAMIGVVVLSDGYSPWVDLIHNVLYILRISYRSDDGEYLFNFRTSYVLFVLTCMFAFGLTTYLEITRLRQRQEAESAKPTNGPSEMQ